MVQGINCVNFSVKSQCLSCLKSKIHTQPFPVSQNRAQHQLELIDTDVCGPMEKKSIGGASYFITFIDDMTRRVFVYFIKSKDEVYEKFVVFKNMAESQLGRKIKAIRSDNGREFVNKRFDNLLQENGIVRQLQSAAKRRGRASQPNPGGNGQEFAYSFRNDGEPVGRGGDDSVLHQKSVANCSSRQNYSL